MKTITGIILGIFLISCISAIDITAGESYSFVLNEPYSYYEVTGNQTKVNLNITQNEANVTIDFGKYMKSDIFTITFYNWKDEVIYSSGGGGAIPNTLTSTLNETIIKNKYILFKLEELHRIQYMGMKDGYGVFIIRSNPIEVNLKEGESADLEIEGEILNLEIVKLYPQKAEIYLSFVSEIEAVEANISVEDIEIEPIEETEKNFGWEIVFGFLGGLVIFILIKYILSKKKNEK